MFETAPEERQADARPVPKDCKNRQDGFFDRWFYAPYSAKDVYDVLWVFDVLQILERTTPYLPDFVEGSFVLAILSGFHSLVIFLSVARVPPLGRLDAEGTLLECAQVGTVYCALLIALLIWLEAFPERRTSTKAWAREAIRMAGLWFMSPPVYRLWHSAFSEFGPEPGTCHATELLWPVSVRSAWPLGCFAAVVVAWFLIRSYLFAQELSNDLLDVSLILDTYLPREWFPSEVFHEHVYKLFFWPVVCATIQWARDGFSLFAAWLVRSIVSRQTSAQLNLRLIKPALPADVINEITSYIFPKNAKEFQRVRIRARYGRWEVTHVVTNAGLPREMKIDDLLAMF